MNFTGGGFTINSQGKAKHQSNFMFEPPTTAVGGTSGSASNNSASSASTSVPSSVPSTTFVAPSTTPPKTNADSNRLNELLSSLRMTDGPEAVLRELKNQMEKFKKLSVNPEDAAAAYDQAVKHFDDLRISSAKKTAAVGQPFDSSENSVMGTATGGNSTHTIFKFGESEKEEQKVESNIQGPTFVFGGETTTANAVSTPKSNPVHHQSNSVPIINVDQNSGESTFEFGKNTTTTTATTSLNEEPSMFEFGKTTTDSIGSGSAASDNNQDPRDGEVFEFGQSSVQQPSPSSRRRRNDGGQRRVTKPHPPSTTPPLTPPTFVSTAPTALPAPSVPLVIPSIPVTFSSSLFATGSASLPLSSPVLNNSDVSTTDMDLDSDDDMDEAGTTTTTTTTTTFGLGTATSSFSVPAMISEQQQQQQQDNTGETNDEAMPFVFGSSSIAAATSPARVSTSTRRRHNKSNTGSSSAKKRGRKKSPPQQQQHQQQHERSGSQIGTTANSGSDVPHIFSSFQAIAQEYSERDETTNNSEHNGIFQFGQSSSANEENNVDSRANVSRSPAPKRQHRGPRTPAGVPTSRQPSLAFAAVFPPSTTTTATATTATSNEVKEAEDTAMANDMSNLNIHAAVEGLKAQAEDQATQRNTERRAEAERLKQRGNIKYNSEDYTSAIRLYGRAVRLVPDNPTYLLNRAAALIMVERYEDAISDSMEATRTNPMLVKGYLRAGRSMLALGRTTDAREQFQKCVWTRPTREAMDPKTLERIHSEAQNGLRQVISLETHLRECASLLRQARNVHGVGVGHKEENAGGKTSTTRNNSSRKKKIRRPTDVDRRASQILATEALKHAESAAALATGSVEPLRCRIGAMLANATFPAFERAVTTCRSEQQRRASKYARAVASMETVYDSSEVDGAEDMLERMRIVHAVESATLSLLEGRALHLCGDLPGSERVLHKAHTTLRSQIDVCNPEAVVPSLNMMSAADRRRKSQRAGIVAGRRNMMRLQSELTSEQRTVRDMQTRRECGNTEFRNVKYAKAYDAYTGALSVDPCHEAYNAILYCNRAAALMMLGLFSEAMNDCDEALKRRTYYPKARQRRANALRSNGQLADARVELEKLRVEMQRKGDHQKIPETTMEKLFGVDYRTVESEYNEVISLLATEEERKTRTRSRFSRFGSDGYGSKGGYGTGRRGSTGSSSGGQGQPRSQRRSSHHQHQQNGSSGSDYQRPGSRAHQSNNHRPRDARYSSSSSSSSRHNGSSASRGGEREYNAYTVLGVNRNASSGTIKKAYHKLALKYHPDKAKPVTGGEDPAAVFKRINEAYSKLKDPSNKRQYDMENSGGSRRRSW